MPRVTRRTFAEVWGDVAKLQTKDLKELQEMIGVELGKRKAKETTARKPRPAGQVAG